MSLNLNPIDYLWDQLKHRISAPDPPLHDLQEVRVAVVAEWSIMLQNSFQSLLRSVSQRCQTVIDAHSGVVQFRVHFEIHNDNDKLLLITKCGVSVQSWRLGIQ